VSCVRVPLGVDRFTAKGRWRKVARGRKERWYQGKRANNVTVRRCSAKRLAGMEQDGGRSEGC